MAFFKPNEVVFITGGASGIGQATVFQFIEDGIRNIAIVDWSEENLKLTSEAVAQKNQEVKILAIKTDISKLEDVERAMKETVDTFNHVDYCVNCAAIVGTTGPIDVQDMETVDRVWSVNLRGAFLCEQAEIRQFLRQDLRPLNTGVPQKTRGSIVNISSICGHVAVRGTGSYNISKHGVIGMVKTDALDYAAKGIRVNAVCPGFVRTNIVSDEVWESLDPTAAQIPMARISTPAEIAPTICFLSSDRASYITGSSVTIDGGLTAQ